MTEGCQRFRKATASTSGAEFVFDRGLFCRLETDHRIRSAGAPVLRNVEPHQVYPHSSELDQAPDSGVASVRSYS